MKKLLLIRILSFILGVILSSSFGFFKVLSSCSLYLFTPLLIMFFVDFLIVISFIVLPFFLKDEEIEYILKLKK